ncbi:MAG: carbohydrate deacetylase [Alphaproteobacteria bacterium]
MSGDDDAPVLVVNADDLGMCHSVNAGILDAFRHGIVTQASIMAPCPAFRDAASLAIQHRLPVAVHLTLASEWDQVRWASLTGAPGLHGEDGFLPLHPNSFQEERDKAILVAEMNAQVDAVLGAGLDPIHLDHHMEAVGSVAASTCERYGLRCRDYLKGHEDAYLAFSSALNLTPIAGEKKEQALVDYIRSIDSGAHLVICHPAQNGPDLDGLCSLAMRRRRLWAYDYRINDLSILTSPVVREALTQSRVRLATSADVGAYSPQG